jgi:hypothetical protein
MNFPVRRDQFLMLPPWMWDHLLTTWIMFAGLYVVTWLIKRKKIQAFYVASSAGLYYPIRALLWKPPWGLGYDPNDAVNAYVWGAVVPFLSVLIVFLIFFWQQRRKKNGVG